MNEKFPEATVVADFEVLEDLIVRDALYEIRMREKFPANQLLTNDVPYVVHHDLYKLGARTQPRSNRSEGHNVFWPDGNT